MKKVFIYSLDCPITGVPRYVGKTTQTLKERLRQHMKDKEHNHKTNWIKSLKNKGGIPVLSVLDIITISEWKFWEQHYISLFKSWGFNLVNSSNGGDGSESFTEETKLKISNSKLGIKNPRYGKPAPNKGIPISEIRRIETSKKHKGNTYRRFDTKNLTSKISKLSYGNILEIRKIYSKGELTQKEIALSFNIGQDHVSRIINFKRCNYK